MGLAVTDIDEAPSTAPPWCFNVSSRKRDCAPTSDAIRSQGDCCIGRRVEFSPLRGDRASQSPDLHDPLIPRDPLHQTLPSVSTRGRRQPFIPFAKLSCIKCLLCSLLVLYPFETLEGGVAGSLTALRTKNVAQLTVFVHNSPPISSIHWRYM